MRRIGDSELEVAPLALGGNVFDWTADEATSFAMLDAFVDAGGTMIDTADVYSAWVPGHQGGESESVIGRWLKRDPAKRDKVVIATKVGSSTAKSSTANMSPRSSRRSSPARATRRCSGLGIERIDLYYQHQRQSRRCRSPTASARSTRLRRAGKIRAIGLSQFHRRADRRGGRDRRSARASPRPPRLQPWYNMVERAKFERDAARGGAPQPPRRVSLLQPRQRLPDRQIPLRGRPCQKRPGRAVARLSRRARAPRCCARSTRSRRRRARRSRRSRSPGLMAQPAIVAPIASATSVEQLKELTAAMDLRLSPDQLDRLTEASAETLPA